MGFCQLHECAGFQVRVDVLMDQTALQVGENQGLMRSQKAVAADGPAEGVRPVLPVEERRSQLAEE